MEQTPFSDKVEIIAEAYIGDPDAGHPAHMNDYFLSYDVSTSIALAIYFGGVTTITDRGRDWIEDGWSALCELMQIDQYGEYESWQQILDFLDE